MALDEFLFKKFTGFYTKRQERKLLKLEETARLEKHNHYLTILAQAVTGESIKIYPAISEGGLKNESFFLPTYVKFFDTHKENLEYYIFRTLFMATQYKLQLNWKDNLEHELKESRMAAKENAQLVLSNLYEEFPVCKEIHEKLVSFSSSKTGEKTFGTEFIYGKWMTDNVEIDKVKSAPKDKSFLKAIKNDDIKTTMKAKPVEEIVSLEVDKKQQEDYVLNHNFEKVETAEEHEGGWRDFDGDDDLKKHEQALDELNMKFTVRVDDTVHSIYRADYIENTSVSQSQESESSGHYYAYDEWNYKKNSYQIDFCKVYPETIHNKDVAFYLNTLKKHSATLIGLRKMLTSLNNKYQQQRRLKQGEEFDMDALTDRFVDIFSRQSPEEKVYLSKRKKEKDLSLLLLLDLSLSSDSFAAGNKVIEVEKEISVLFGEILNEHQVDFSIAGYHSKTRNKTNYVLVKDFDEEWHKAKYKIGALEASGYTRIGAAIRHAGACLDQRDTKNKWVVLLSDGKPNDYDKYEGKYGVKDVKQALRELNQNNINSYALAIESQAKYYLPQMFGVNHFEILTNPVELLKSLAKLYDKIKFKS